MKLYEAMKTNSNALLQKAIIINNNIEYINSLKRKLNYLYKIAEYGQIEQIENTLKTMGVN